MMYTLQSLSDYKFDTPPSEFYSYVPAMAAAVQQGFEPSTSWSPELSCYVSHIGCKMYSSLVNKGGTYSNHWALWD